MQIQFLDSLLIGLLEYKAKKDLLKVQKVEEETKITVTSSTTNSDTGETEKTVKAKKLTKEEKRHALYVALRNTPIQEGNCLDLDTDTIQAVLSVSPVKLVITDKEGKVQDIDYEYHVIDISANALYYNIIRKDVNGNIKTANTEYLQLLPANGGERNATYYARKIGSKTLAYCDYAIRLYASA
jgi:hypothetical protein